VLVAEAERAAAALLRALDGAAAALAAATSGAGGSPRLPAALSGTLEALAADLGGRRAAAAALHAALAGDAGACGGASAAGRFEWVDGALTRAVEEGRWVLLDNAGACPATVRARCSSAPSATAIEQHQRAVCNT
jgi:midasin